MGRDAWLPYLVRDEPIHKSRNEPMGMFRIHPGPEWFIKGMAYTLSDDPHSDLGSPWQAHREQFNAWYKGSKKADLWAEAAHVRHGALYRKHLRILMAQPMRAASTLRSRVSAQAQRG